MRARIWAAALAGILLLGGCEQASDAVFGARVRAYLLNNPEVLEEAVAKLAENREAAAAEKAQAVLATRRDEVERDPRDFVANPNGKITVTEFYDYHCTFCKAAAPAILALIRDNPDVRFVFKEHPIFEGSDEAAALALAAKDEMNYLDLYREFYEAPQLGLADMERILSNAGLDPEALKREAVSEPIVDHLGDTYELALAMGINGTPTFIVGDKMIPGADLAALNAAIEAERRKS